MKKIFLCLLALIAMTGCKQDEPAPIPTDNPVNTDDPVNTEDVAVNPELEAMASHILEGLELPAYEITNLDAESFEYFAFVPHQEGIEAVTADALINSIAHSVVLIKMPETAAEDEINTLANEIKENANPNKWICVEAEKVEVAVKENYILLVMSSADNTTNIINNFNSME